MEWLERTLIGGYIRWMLKMLALVLGLCGILWGVSMAANAFGVQTFVLSGESFDGVLRDSLQYCGKIGTLFGYFCTAAEIPSIRLGTAESMLLKNVIFALLSIVCFKTLEAMYRLIKKILGEGERFRFGDVPAYGLITCAAVAAAQMLNGMTELLTQKMGFAPSSAVVIVSILIITALYAKITGKNWINLTVDALLSILNVACIYLLMMCILTITSYGDMLMWHETAMLVGMMTVCTVLVGICGPSLLLGVDSFK